MRVVARMTSDGQAVERLRDYLRTLTPEARALLAAELERGILAGEESPGNELILQELRRTIPVAGPPAAARMGEAARMFFVPVEPFVIDDAADHKRAGRIARVSLDPLWGWIARDLMPAETKALGADIDRALLANDRLKAEQRTRALQDRAILRIREAMASVTGDEKARRRLVVQVGTPRALEDLATLTGILENRDLLNELARRLPSHLRTFERDQIDSVKLLLESAIAQKTQSGSGLKADVFLYGFILIMGRLATPWQLIRIATRAAETDEAARIAETPYGRAVTIVLGEVECLVNDLRNDLKTHRPVTSLLKNIHDAARGLRTEIDLSGDSPWSRQLTAIRTEVSNVLRAEIETTPGRVRRLLRPRPAKEIVPGSQLDETDVAEAEMMVEFVGACRTYAHELAVNEMTMRSYTELQNYLESGTKVLLDSLRQAGDTDRAFRHSQMDAAIRFCRSVFGADYAALLGKAAEIAAQTTGFERKSARA